AKSFAARCRGPLAADRWSLIDPAIAAGSAVPPAGHEGHEAHETHEAILIKPKNLRGFREFRELRVPPEALGILLNGASAVITFAAEQRDDEPSICTGERR